MTDLEERARAFVAAKERILSRKMADIPHFYCLKKDSLDPDEFN